MAVTDDAGPGGFDDSGCTLRDAILAANTNAHAGGTRGLGCDGDNGGGTGVDTILLQGGRTDALGLRQALDEDSNAAGDLDITGGGGTIIRATGTGLATIDAGNTVFPGPADNQRERVLDIIAGAGAVTLEGIRVTGGVDNESPPPGTSVVGGDGAGDHRARTAHPDQQRGERRQPRGLRRLPQLQRRRHPDPRPRQPHPDGSAVAGNTVKANSASPNNSARGAGIAFFSGSGPLVATNSTISGNVVDSSGNTINTTTGAAIDWSGFGQTMTLTNSYCGFAIRQERCGRTIVRRYAAHRTSAPESSARRRTRVDTRYESWFTSSVAYRTTERTEARRAETRERIVTAARELIAEGGYVAAQIAAVADRAGVAVGTVYRHFPSKSDLFAEVFREASQHEVDAMREAIHATSGPAAERIAAGIEVFARRALRGKRLAWALLAEPVDPAVEAERLQFRHSYRDLMAEVISEGIEAGDLPQQDADATAAAMIGAIGETMLGPLSPTTNGGDAEALIASLIDFCTRAIGEEH